MTWSIAISSSPTSFSCDSVGVIRSWRRTTEPSRATTPARIFVPPRSTPIACVAVAVMRCGYRTLLDGRLRREAIPRLPGRTAEGQGAAARARRSAPSEAAARWTAGAAAQRPPPSATGVLARTRIHVVAGRRRPRARLVGGRRVLRRARRRQRREQAAPVRITRHRRRAETDRRADDVDAVEHPPDRHRPFRERPGRAQLGPAL